MASGDFYCSQYGHNFQKNTGHLQVAFQIDSLTIPHKTENNKARCPLQETWKRRFSNSESLFWNWICKCIVSPALCLESSYRNSISVLGSACRNSCWACFYDDPIFGQLPPDRLFGTLRLSPPIGCNRYWMCRWVVLGETATTVPVHRLQIKG